MSTYTVALNYQANYGYVEYDEATKTAKVTLSVEEAKAAAENFFRTPLTLNVPNGETIRDFETITIDPLADMKSFKLALTRLWVNTGVRVEWSLPPGLGETIKL